MATFVGALASGFFLQVVASGQSIRPSSLSFADLTDGQRFQSGRVDEVLAKALGEQGIVALRDIPRFSELRKVMLRDAHSCIAVAPHAQSLALEDGSVRRQLAATSVSAVGLQPVDHGSDSKACSAFQLSSNAFREAVGGAVDVFSKRLSEVLAAGEAIKLPKSDGVGSYNSLEDIVKHGDRLEHFRSYRVPAKGDGGSGRQTVDFHVDQGLFIAFAPAALLDDASVFQTSAPAGTFTARAANGEETEVEFSEDDLIILAGDAWNQFINDKHPGLRVHAPAHAFSVPADAPGLHRVWYGMMQLPPADAMSGKEGHGPTFAKLRQSIIEATAQIADSALGLGCSGGLQARELMEMSCEANQIHCWHSCMVFTDTVNTEVCKAKGMEVKCMSQFGQVYRDEDGHGDYWPECSNATEFITPRPTVEQPTGACDGFQALIDDASYSKRKQLANDTYLLWKVVGDEVKCKMVTKGIVGWLGFGTANIGGKQNGMNGASVVMGLNDLKVGMTINEYRIDDSKTAFRWWKTPLTSTNVKSKEMVATGCFSTMTFQTKAIGEVALNMTGTNYMLWALSKQANPTTDFGGYAPYHTGVSGGDPAQYRGLVEVDFSAGQEILATTAVGACDSRSDALLWAPFLAALAATMTSFAELF